MGLSDSSIELYVLKKPGGECLYNYNLTDHNRVPKTDPVLISGLLTAIKYAMKSMWPCEDEYNKLKFTYDNIKCRLYNGTNIELAVLVSDSPELDTPFKKLIKYLSKNIITSFENNFESNIKNGICDGVYGEEIERQIKYYRDDYQIIYYKNILTTACDNNIAVKDCEELTSLCEGRELRDSIIKLYNNTPDIGKIIKKSHEDLGLIWDLLKIKTIKI